MIRQRLGELRLLFEEFEGLRNVRCSVDGALDAWMPILFEALGADSANFIRTEKLPSPRISMSKPAISLSQWREIAEVYSSTDSHLATVHANTRITAADWHQDVRHIEFDFDEDIRWAASSFDSGYPF